MARITQRKGDIATSQALATFTAFGYDVSIPFTESAPYDLIVDTGARLHRVQCKYCSTGIVGLRRVHSNAQGYVVKKSARDSYDWLYVYSPDGNEYLVQECLHGRNALTLNDAYRLVPGALPVSTVG